MLSELELEFVYIKYRWRTHSELFDDNKNVDLLNRCGGQVFAMLQQLLVYDTLAAICRLCDPPKSAGQENNSIANQYNKQKSKLEPFQIQEIDALLLTLESKMENIRLLRNKVMSHNDLGVAEKAIILPSIKYGEVDEVIQQIGNILNKIYRVSGTYSSVTAFGPGAAKLLEVLREGEVPKRGNEMSVETETKNNLDWIIKLYPFGVLLISFIFNLLLGETSIEASLPSVEILKILSLAAVILVFNHSWIMTNTELTRLRFKIFATPEEWRDSGLSKDSITEKGQFEIDRNLNTHRNTTENTVYYIFLAIVFSFTSPPVLVAAIWLLMFPIARIGYTYSYFSGKDGVRGVFMSLTLLSVYGLSVFLVLGILSI